MLGVDYSLRVSTPTFIIEPIKIAPSCRREQFLFLVRMKYRVFFLWTGGGVVGVQAPVLEPAFGIVPHKAVDHGHKRNEEDHAQNAEKLSAQQSGGQGP